MQRKKIREQNIQELWDNFKRYNIHTIRLLEVENGAEEIIEVILAETVPKLMTDTLPKTQEKTIHMDITRWSTLKSDGLYSLQPKMRSSIQSAKTRPGADCGSYHELLIAKFRLKLKKVGKTSRPFRHSVYQM